MFHQQYIDHQAMQKVESFKFIHDINFFAMLLMISFMSMNLGLSSQAYMTEKKKEFADEQV